MPQLFEIVVPVIILVLFPVKLLVPTANLGASLIAKPDIVSFLDEPDWQAMVGVLFSIVKPAGRPVSHSMLEQDRLACCFEACVSVLDTFW